MAANNREHLLEDVLMQCDNNPHGLPSGDVLLPLTTASKRQDLDALANHLTDLREFLATDLRDVESMLGAIGDVCITNSAQPPAANHVPSVDPADAPTDRVSRAKQHLLALRGKRIRPLCVLLAARVGGRMLDRDVRDLAVACELVHAATLLHDDVIDDSAERRGAPSARILYGNAASILAGDHLLVEALRLVQRAEVSASSVPSSSLLTGILNVISQMVAAEALQLERRGRFEPDRDTYLRVIEGKTASLFVWGLRAGGCMAGLDTSASDALGKVGLSLGLAFQLVDDVLDMEGDPRILGKNAWVDLREGKLTWPMILASERDPRFCTMLRDMLQQSARDGVLGDTRDAFKEQDMTDIVQCVRRTEALHDTRAFALHHVDQAFMALDTLPANHGRDALRWVIESAVHRVR